MHRFDEKTRSMVRRRLGPRRVFDPWPVASITGSPRKEEEWKNNVRISTKRHEGVTCTLIQAAKISKCGRQWQTTSEDQEKGPR